ncbi:19992_t:CDS:2, partial [Gigaspora rosea]
TDQKLSPMHALQLDEAIKRLEALKSMIINYILAWKYVKCYTSDTDIEVSLYFTKSTTTSTPYDQIHHMVPEVDLNNHVPQEQTDNVPDDSLVMNIVDSIEYRPQEQTNFPYCCPICQRCYLYCSYCSQDGQLNEL